MESKELTVAIVGSGGDGVVSAGEIITRAAAREGLYCFLLKSFGPQIRGGESSIKVRMSSDELFSHGDFVDVLMVFNWADFGRFKKEIIPAKNAVFLMEEKDKTPADKIPVSDLDSYRLIKVPFNHLASTVAGSALAKNIVALGVLAELFNVPKKGLIGAIEKKFAHKKREVIDKNINALQVGIDWARENVSDRDTLPRFVYEAQSSKIMISGNEAVALGALYAGLDLFAGYPITPSSEVLEMLGRELPRFGGEMVQVEDEMAAIGVAIGASFAGKKAMTATSGPGVSLMGEMIGLASITELPLVLVNVQRVGPSTGIPTKTTQADLQQALYGTHGDAPRVILAPSDVEDCFDVTVEAFYIAEKYQIPVLILSDQYLGQRIETIRKEALYEEGDEYGFLSRYHRDTPTEEELKNYQRYRYTESGVSPTTYPGIPGGEYTAAGIEHDVVGWPTSEVDVLEKNNEKRFKKFELIRKELKFTRHYGPDDAEVGIITWGSMKGAVKEAVLRLNAQGRKVSALVPQVIYPICRECISDFVAGKKKVIIAEMSYTAQFYKYLRSHLDIPLDIIETLKAPIGTPAKVSDVIAKLEEVCDDINC